MQTSESRRAILVKFDSPKISSILISLLSSLSNEKPTNEDEIPQFDTHTHSHEQTFAEEETENTLTEEKKGKKTARF